MINVTWLKTGEDGDLQDHDATYFTQAETRQLRHWVEQMLRLEDAKVGRTLYSFLNHVVYAQAKERGRLDAHEFGESRLHSVAAGVWRDGYTEGFAIGMVQRYERST